MKPGYKQTEIGMIPEDWEVKPAEDLMKIETGSRNTEDKVEGGQFPFFVRSQKAESIDTFHYNCEAVLTAGDGVGTGKVFHYYNGKFDAHQRVYVMSAFSGINGKFFYYYFGNNFSNEVSKMTAKTSVDSVRRDMIAKMPILVPPILQQDCIAEALSDVDELIASLEKLIEKKKAIKQGVMLELLTGKRRLPGFSGEWKSVCLSDIGHFIKGSGISRADTNSGKLPAVRYGELYTKHTDYVKKYYSHISCDVAANAVPVTFGAILFAASGETKEEIGKCAAIIEKHTVYAGGDILIFIPDKSTHPVFLGTLLNIPEVCKQKAQRGQGDAIVHIHADSLSEIEVQIPEYDEQAAIADVLLSADREIDLMEMKITKARQVKQGMMQQLLTGKMRL